MNQYYTTNTDIYHIPPPPNEKDEAIIMLDKMIKCRAKNLIDNAFNVISSLLFPIFYLANN